MGKTIVITGGAGFVGSNIAAYLKKRYENTDIIAFDNLKRRGSELNLPKFASRGVAFAHGDIRNVEDFDELPKADCVIECSAEPSVLAGINSSLRYLIETNLHGTVNCLEYARKSEADIIFLSTSRVYPIEAVNRIRTKEGETRFQLEDEQEIPGVSGEGISEDFPLSGVRSFYGTTKLSSELLIQEYCSDYPIRGVINRCGVIAGPGQFGKVDQGVVALWVAKHMMNQSLTYIGYGGTGKQVRDMLHIDDLCRLVAAELDDMEKYSGKVFNVGGGPECSASLVELTKVCSEVTENTIDIGSVSETRPNDIKLYITDNSKIIAASGWMPEKSVRDIVADTYTWMKTEKETLQGVLL